jgi:hypothetical protein
VNYRDFAYPWDDGYIAAAKRVRVARAGYFAACQVNPWNDHGVRLALNAYQDALDIARVEEDRVLAAMKERDAKPATTRRVRFS